MHSHMAESLFFNMLLVHHLNNTYHTAKTKNRFREVLFSVFTHGRIFVFNMLLVHHLNNTYHTAKTKNWFKGGVIRCIHTWQNLCFLHAIVYHLNNTYTAKTKNWFREDLFSAFTHGRIFVF